MGLDISLRLSFSKEIETICKKLSISRAHAVGIVATLLSRAAALGSLNRPKTSEEIADLCSLCEEPRITKNELIWALELSGFIERSGCDFDNSFFISENELYSYNFKNKKLREELESSMLFDEIRSGRYNKDGIYNGPR